MAAARCPGSAVVVVAAAGSAAVRSGGSAAARSLSRLSPLRTGSYGTSATGQNGLFLETHQKVAGAGPDLGSEPLHAVNVCKPVRRIYKRRKQKSDLKTESISIHWGSA